MSLAKLESLQEDLKKANKLAKELIKLNDVYRERYLAVRSRLVVLTILHKDELQKMGIDIDKWIKALEIDDSQQLNAITLHLKERHG